MKLSEPKLEEDLLGEILDEISIGINICIMLWNGPKFGSLREFYLPMKGKKNPICCRIDFNLTEVSIYKERKVKEKKPWYGAKSWELIVGVDLRDPSSIDNLRKALKALQDG